MNETACAAIALASFGFFSIQASGRNKSAKSTAITASTAGITATNVSSGYFGANRLRFVGVEDMGGGMKTNFWLEMQPGFNGSTSGNGLFNRGAWLGMSGGWGEMRLGRQGTTTIGLVCTIDQSGCYGGFFGGGLLEVGNEEQARSELQNALALDPNNKLALNLMRQMTEDPVVSKYLAQVMFDEIVPFVPLPEAQRRAYAVGQPQW